MPIYATLDVQCLWLINPILQMLESYPLHERHWLLQNYFKDDDLVSVSPFAEHTFPLSNLWE